MQTVVTKTRKDWIDALRAVAMLFVIYGHLLSGHGHSEFYVVTSPIKIPLFFAITGYVFNPRNGDTKAFFKNLIKKLIVPFVFFTIILMPFKLIAAKHGFVNHSVEDVFISFITGNEFWYLPCCIIAEMLFFFINKYVKKTNQVIITCVGLSILGFVLAKVGVLSVLNANTAFIAQLFIAIGFLYLRKECWIQQHWKSIIITSLTLCFVICAFSIAAYQYQSIDVHKNYYYCVPLNILSIITGNIALFTIADHFSIKSKILSFIGKNTIVYYVTHEYVIGMLKVIFRLFHIHETGSYLFEFGMLIVVCIACAGISYFINKHLPFAVGKAKQ